jgi:hypothetical protein
MISLDNPPSSIALLEQGGDIDSYCYTICERGKGAGQLAGKVDTRVVEAGSLASAIAAITV